MLTVYGTDSDIKSLLHIIEKGKMNTTRDEMDNIGLNDNFEFKCIRIDDNKGSLHRVVVDN